MDEEWTKLAVRFLVKEAIKERHDVRGRLWDAIYKAHRDTMTGARTGNIDHYREVNRNGANATLDFLYDTIIAQTAPLCSDTLISAIREKDPQIEFAAAQKLVNMTLKYIMILKKFEPEGVQGVTVCEEKCDCPIDSVIISKLREHKDVTWTTMDKAKYNDVQKEIRKMLDEPESPYQGKGKIWFDFWKWNEK